MRLIILVLFSALSLLAQNSMTAVARVNGVDIYEIELPIGPQLQQLRRQEYDLRLNAARTAVAKKVLELAAQAKGLTIEQYLADLDKTIAPSSDAELSGYYLARRDEYRQPFDKVKEQVRKACWEIKQQIARQAMAQELLAKADVRIFLQPPRQVVDPGNSPRIGPVNAPVTIIEFSDYQCPYCKHSEEILHSVLDHYGDKLALVYKDFPLEEIHADAQPAAQASHCADDQGKFRAYHDAMFNASPKLNSARLIELAREAGLDAAKFQSCLESGKMRDRVAQDIAVARSLGVIGTPAFFINGVSLTGAASASDFEKLIDAELSAQK